MFENINRINIAEVDAICAANFTETNLLRRGRRGTFPAGYKIGQTPAVWNAAQVIAWARRRAGTMLDA